MGMPSTLAAFIGSSGKTVKLLVSITAANRQEPQTEEEAERLYQMAYPYAVKVYSGLFAGQVVEEKATARASFRMTFDPEPLLNMKATALVVQPVPAERPELQTQSVQRKTDYDKYNDYEYLYRSAVAQVNEDMGSRFDGDPHRKEAYLSALASRLHQLGLPEEEAVLHMRSHL